MQDSNPGTNQYGPNPKDVTARTDDAACPREEKAGACGNQGDMGGSRPLRMTTWEYLEGDAPYPVS